MQDVIDENPEKIDRFMEALVMADEFAKNNMDEVYKIIAEVDNVDPETIESLMTGYKYGLVLDQASVIGATERAQWMVDEEYAPEGAEIPDYRSMMYAEPLLKYAPDSVTLE
jgi:ABC-type nitrate/sulfonate/bicarbonate transport system substrate-binding protein